LQYNAINKTLYSKTWKVQKLEYIGLTSYVNCDNVTTMALHIDQIENTLGLETSPHSILAGDGSF
jgi:hypothetical protein